MEEIIKELRQRIEAAERHVGLMSKEWEAKEKQVKAPKKK